LTQALRGGFCFPMRWRTLIVATIAIGFAVGFVNEAKAQAARPFDFYVLALSWSPTHCGEPGMAQRDRQQCGGTRPYGFVVHGLWPQYERGFPRSCPSQMPRPARVLIGSMLDIMPSERLVQIQWERHGTCSGLAPESYFAALRNARRQITIPSSFQSPKTWATLSAGQIESAFMVANPMLPARGIAVESNRNRLREVRICLTKQMAFRACPEVDRGGVALNVPLAIPPTRG